MLLGVSEVVSHRYSERKDDLVEIQQIADKKAHDDEMTRVQHDTALANERAEILKRENLVLAEALSPRSIRSDVAEKTLSKFAGTKYFVVSAPDLEPRDLAAQIRSVLRRAGWQKLEKLPPELRAFPKGWAWPVALEYDVSARDKWGPLWEAIGALSEQMRNSGISNKPTHSDIPEGWPPDAVRIVIGLKPTNVTSKPGIWGGTSPEDWNED
jgi:hypothetical protein